MIGNRTPCQATGFYRYGVYGISLRSEIPLPLPEYYKDSLVEIELSTGSADWFVCMTQGAQLLQSSTFWHEYSRLQDGSSYLRWERVGEFVISCDGKTIVCRPFDIVTAESFHVYLLGQALSFALVKQGLEPLHATAIVVDGGAVVFLGDSGFGKSTLAAWFLATGHRLLTDDLLVLKQTSGTLWAFPGPSRIKLLPNIALKYLGTVASCAPMNPFTRKMILPLHREQVSATAIPLRAIYLLAGARDRHDGEAIRIESLSPRQTFLELLKNTFNRRIVDTERLERQFTVAGYLASVAPVRKVSYPRALDRLPAVCEVLLSDLRWGGQEQFAVG